MGCLFSLGSMKKWGVVVHRRRALKKRSSAQQTTTDDRGSVEARTREGGGGGGQLTNYFIPGSLLTHVTVESHRFCNEAPPHM